MPSIDKLEYARAHTNVPAPRRGSVEAAGLDLGLPHNLVLPAGGKVFVDLGIAFNIPEGHYMSIKPRSNTCDNKTAKGDPAFDIIITLVNSEAVIDSDYTGNIKLKIQNNGRETFLGYQGDYIVQAILEEYVKPTKLVEVDKITKQTERGDQAFGSTETTRAKPKA